MTLWGSLVVAALGAAPQNAVTLEVPGLFWNAVAVGAERRVTPWLGVGVTTGLRLGAVGESTSWSLSAGAQARYYLPRFQLLSEASGPFAGVRWDSSWTRVTVGGAPRAVSNYTSTWSARVGYRLVVWERLDLAAEGGLAVAVEFDRIPRLTAFPRVLGVFGFTVGYAF